VQKQVEINGCGVRRGKYTYGTVRPKNVRSNVATEESKRLSYNLIILFLFRTDLQATRLHTNFRTDLQATRLHTNFRTDLQATRLRTNFRTDLQATRLRTNFRTDLQATRLHTNFLGLSFGTFRCTSVLRRAPLYRSHPLQFITQTPED
jgi:hypothetical protein